MSAPTALEGEALRRGIAWRVTAAQAQPSVHVDPFEALREEQEDLCCHACDPYEIAAVLEAAGLNDGIARTTFEVAGVFEIAERLWHDVPWSAQEEPDADVRWRLPFWRAQARGTIYVLPGTVAMLAAGQLFAGGSQLALFGMAAASIALGQGLSLLMYALVGRGHDAAAATSGWAAVALGALVAAVCAVVPGLGPGAAAAYGGQLIYVSAATALLVLGRDLALLASVVPGAAVALVAVALPAPAASAGGRPGVVALMVAGAAATVVVPVVVLAGTLRGRGGGPSLRRAVGWGDLRQCALAAVYGLVLSVSLSVCLFAAARRSLLAGTGDLLLVTAPLVLSLGTAEYLVHRARRRCLTAAARARRVTTFSAAAVRELALLLVRYVLVVTAVVTAVTLGTTVRQDAALMALTAWYGVLAVNLCLITTLISLGGLALATALLAGCTALAAAPLLVPAATSGVTGSVLVVPSLAVLALCLPVLFVVVARRFGRTSVHR